MVPRRVEHMRREYAGLPESQRRLQRVPGQVGMQLVRVQGRRCCDRLHVHLQRRDRWPGAPVPNQNATHPPPFALPPRRLGSLSPHLPPSTSRVSGLCGRLAQPGGGCATSVGGPRWRCSSRSLCGRLWVFVMSESGPPDHRAAHVSLSLSVLPAPATAAAAPLGSRNPPSCAHGAACLSIPRRPRMRAPPCAALPLAVCPLPVPRSSPSRSPSLSGCLPMASSSSSS